jgi:hypothetical protein
MAYYQHRTVPSNLTDQLSMLIGKPQIFGTTLVYSGYVPIQTDLGTIIQINENEAKYNIILNDFESIPLNSTTTGMVAYDLPWNGLLTLSSNSSFKLEI